MGWNLYPPDIFSGLWENLEKLIHQNMLSATEEVLIELQKKEDGLYQWAKSQSGLFVTHDLNIQKRVKKILSNFPGLIDLKKNKSGADPFVVAHAYENRFTVITEEKKSSNPDKPKIPNICDGLGVDYMNFITLMRKRKLRF